jgi:SNF2 family DNA or RNA helicase
MEPGTGKTKVAVDFCGRMFMDKNVHRVLVIAPLSALTVWEREIEKHLGVEVPRKVIRLRGGVKEKIKQMDFTDDLINLYFVLINYESAWRSDLKKELDKYQPQCVIVDESHKIKNPMSRQSKAVCTFRNVRHKLILTGTPITKSPLDIFGQWKFLRPEVFGENWWAFQARFAVFGGFKNYEIVKYKNMDHLRREVHHDAYICSADECLQLPPKVFQNIDVELQPNARKIYNKMEKDFLVSLADGAKITAPIVLTKMLRLSQITGGFITDESSLPHPIGAEKIFVLKELLTNYTYPDRKVVVFARFLPEIERIKQAAREVHLEPSVLVGGMNPTKWDLEVDTFQNDPRRKVLIAQIATGGVSIDLTAARTVIYYSYDFDYAHYDQSWHRVHRHGQKQKTLFLHLVMKDTIDEVVFKSLQEKKDLSQLIVEYKRKKEEEALK